MFRLRRSDSRLKSDALEELKSELTVLVDASAASAAAAFSRIESDARRVHDELFQCLKAEREYQQRAAQSLERLASRMERLADSIDIILTPTGDQIGVEINGQPASVETLKQRQFDG